MRESHALLLTCVLSLLVGAWFSAVWRRYGERRRARSFNQRGQRAEQDAVRLLEHQGYAIVSRQLRTRYSLDVDGAARGVSLVLDFVVERGGERFAAEVKSGAASRLEQAETRRQLLEYQLALGGKSVLLVDPANGRVREVAFPIPRPASPQPSRGPLVLAGTLVLLLSAASMWLLAR